MRPGLEGGGDMVTRENRADGDSASKAFCECYYIRLHIEVFIRKEFSRSPHAGLNLIENEQNPVIVTERAHILQISFTGHIDSGFPLYRFEHNRACAF